MEQTSNKSKLRTTRKARRRPCLVCGQPFAVAGKFLRVCTMCKESEEWLSCDANFALHIGSAANDN